MREAGQGRNPAALSEVNCVLFSIALDESSLKGADEYWSSESSLNGPEMNSADIQS